MQFLDAYMRIQQLRATGQLTLETPMDLAGLSVRVRNCCRNYAVLRDGEWVALPILTVRDLLAASEKYLLLTPNFGRRSMSEVRDLRMAMFELGYSDLKVA